MAVLDEIVKWASADLPNWQSDAVRRLLTQDMLSSTDKQELLLMLKEKHHLLASGETSPIPQPLDPSSIPGTQTFSEKVSILAMKDLINVNAIPSDSPPLTFGAEGITIIYGDNASGKSGYARVLKKACQARHTESIYPNIAQTPNNCPPSASFFLTINNDSQKEFHWVDGAQAIKILTNICVFDSKCARIIIDEDNEVVYLPYGASVFRDLVTLCQTFRDRLQAERPRPDFNLPLDIPATTEAGKFLSTINVKTTKSSLDAICKWSQEDEKNLQDLTREIAKVTAEDPKRQAYRLRNLKQRVSGLKVVIEKMNVALSDEAIVTLNKKISEVKAAERAFTIASQQSFSEEPLPGVGDNTWKILYEAAKKYSIEVAYKDKDFPFVGPDSVCVLCMQPLSEEAKERFCRFKTFMEQTTKKDLDIATDSLFSILRELEDIDFDILQSYKDAFDEITARDKSCADLLKVNVEKALVRKMSIQSASQGRSTVEPTNLPVWPFSEINAILVTMDQEADKLENSAAPKQLSSLKASLDELSACKKLTQIKPSLIQYISSLEQADLYDLCIKETDTTSITRRGREIVSAALTQQFKNTIDEELNKFNAKIFLTLESRGAVGETIHKLRLSNCRLPKGAKVTDILSEGEQRIVAIASFLAELEACGHSNPIVFDDPVSSLDHNWRVKVAHRFVAEAAKRQIIVFTHDIFFTTTLLDAAEASHTPLSVRCILRRGDIPGIPTEDIPWKAASVQKSLDALEKDVRSLCKERKSLTTEQYAEATRPIYSKMRSTWENAIERVAFQGAVRRYDAHIRINPNIMKVTVLDITDCKILLAEHKKCCDITEAHSNISATNIPVPEPDEIAQDLSSLKEWIAKIKNKQNALS